MNLEEIKSAVLAGKKVHWANSGYIVQADKSNPPQFSIVFCGNNSRIGLTWLDGVTLNGKESEFFIAADQS